MFYLLVLKNFIILKNTPWEIINRFKKHKSLDSFNCATNNISDFAAFYKKWWGVACIYKITFLYFKLFTYYGSSANLGQRIKYHYYNGKNQNTFLGFFYSLFWY